MKYQVIAFSATVLLLGGCTGQPDSLAAVPAAAPQCLEQSSYAYLPDDSLRVKFPFHLRADRIYSKKSELRRGVELEYLQGAASETWTSMKQSLEVAGYQAVDDASVDSKGVFRQNYAKHGQPKLFVALIPDPGTKPANPEAKGVVRMSWPIGSVSHSAANTPVVDVAASAAPKPKG